MSRDPYKPAQHHATPTPLTAAKPLGPLRRALRAFLLWLAGVVQGHPVWPYPLEQFFALEDRPGRVYIWTLRAEMTDEDALAMAAAFNEEFTRKFGRPTRALHIVTPSIDALRSMSRESAERMIVPWLREEASQ